MVNALGPLFTFKQGSIIDVSLYPKHTSNVHKYLAVKYLLKVIHRIYVHWIKVKNKNTRTNAVLLVNFEEIQYNIQHFDLVFFSMTQVFPW